MIRQLEIEETFRYLNNRYEVVECDTKSHCKNCDMDKTVRQVYHCLDSKRSRNRPYCKEEEREDGLRVIFKERK